MGRLNLGPPLAATSSDFPGGAAKPTRPRGPARRTFASLNFYYSRLCLFSIKCLLFLFFFFLPSMVKFLLLELT